MRILWFTGVTPPAVSRKLRLPPEEGPAGWVENLRLALCNCTDLRIAIAGPTQIPFAPFEENGTVYYGVQQFVPHMLLTKVARAWMQSLFRPNDPAQNCLRIIDHFKPDLIHVHGTENPFGLLKKYTDIPLVISLQGLLTIYQRFYFHGASSADIFRMFLSRHFLAGNNELHGYLRCRIFAEREREIVRINENFVGRTTWDHDFVKLINAKARYFHCDELLRSQFSEAVWCQENCDPLVIYCTGSSMIFKGIECLIEAVSILHANGLEKVRLRIAGVPEDGEVQEFYRRKETKFNAGLAVKWLGRIGPQQIIGELLNAAIFCYPSHIDNSPNALCEAMLVGLPCIASHVGGIPSLLTDQKEGLLFSDGDPFALAGKIQYMLENRQDAKKMGAQARIRAAFRHETEVVCADLLNIYEKAQTAGIL